MEYLKKHLDTKKIVGTVLMGLSEAFYMTCLLPKLHAYRFNKKTLNSFIILKTQKQSVKINKTQASLKSFYQKYLMDLFLHQFSLIFFYN